MISPSDAELLTGFALDGNGALRKEMELIAWDKVHNDLEGYELSGRIVDVAFKTGTEPSPVQMAAFRNLLENEHYMRDVVLSGFLQALPALLDEQEFDAEEREEMLLNARDTDGLKNLVTLAAIFIWDMEQDNMVLVDWEFSVAWDRDHNVTVQTSGDRVVKVKAG